MNAKPENKSLFQCLRCREGCSECVDGTPCMYQRNISLRTVFLTINEAVKALAIGLAVFISVYRESKVDEITFIHHIHNTAKFSAHEMCTIENNRTNNKIPVMYR